jgi:beta-galactosidase/beta-glucuronidase
MIDEGWKFMKGDVAKAEEAGFDDGKWRVVDLPHDWSVEGPYDRTLASCTAFLPCGIGWYRKTLTLGEDAKDKAVSIRFDGVMNHSTVWCNGKEMGQRPYGYSSFTYDLTGALHFDGKPNEIAVRADHTAYADSRWYAGSGIYRDVFLRVTDKTHVATNGTFVTTPKVTKDSAEVEVHTLVKNDGGAEAEAMVSCYLVHCHAIILG